MNLTPEGARFKKIEYFSDKPPTIRLNFDRLLDLPSMLIVDPMKFEPSSRTRQIFNNFFRVRSMK
jgi:hypothetical protein